MPSYRKRSNGKTQITIVHGKTFDGKQKRYYREVDTKSKRELERATALFLSEILAGTVTAGSECTTDALFDDFLQRSQQLSQSTRSRYILLYKNQIQPYFGRRKVTKITRVDVRDWMAKLLECGNKATGEGLAPKTVKHALSLLSTMFNHAIYDLEIVEKNPCEKQPISQKGVKEKTYYSQEELKELLELLAEELADERCITHAVLIHLILFTGLRTGEAMGLRWEDINLDSGHCEIKRERVALRGEVIETSPKTESSVRTITIPAFVLDMLKVLKATQGRWASMNEDWQDTGYVAVTLDGTPQHPRNLYKWFQRFLKKNNLKRASVHDLRHTHAAMLSSMGVKIIDISKRLGHSNTRVTQEVYEYLFNDVDDKISGELDSLYQERLRA